ncbi:hypothetical protein ACP70R_003723 [Stipagrostis hirtigluma subsp. patula]
MPPGKSHKRAPEEAPASGGGRIGALPDELLHHVLSFLPARDAVRTCVLARRWIDLWKSALGLRIVAADGKGPAPFHKVREFVDHLLLLRGCSPLETFELGLSGAAIDMVHLRLWVRYAVLRNVQVLRLRFLESTLARPWPDGPALVSDHLTRLELCGLMFDDEFLNFWRCPSLRYLQIDSCNFVNAKIISSWSLKHLTITQSHFSLSFRTRIHAPNLVLLELQFSTGRTPVLQRMPHLARATVIIRSISCADCCSNSDYGDCDDENCEGCILKDKHCVLLQGLSQAKALALTAVPKMFIFRRDSKQCPTFRRLKIFVINLDWLVPDVHALACILEHSPVLEELHLLCSKKLPVNVKIKGIFNPKELPSTMSTHLKRVEVYCDVVDERVLKVLKFLSKLHILIVRKSSEGCPNFFTEKQTSACHS